MPHGPFGIPHATLGPDTYIYTTRDDMNRTTRISMDISDYELHAIGRAAIDQAKEMIARHIADSVARDLAHDVLRMLDAGAIAHDVEDLVGQLLAERLGGLRRP